MGTLLAVSPLLVDTEAIAVRCLTSLQGSVGSQGRRLRWPPLLWDVTLSLLSSDGGRYKGRSRRAGKRRAAAMMMLEVKRPKASHSWWFESHKNSPRSSSWLASTLQELDGKTKEMLRLIEQDADSFAQRAEMYYKKRPELVNMVEDFYRAHRSLAERYDQLKIETGTRRTSNNGSHLSTKSCSQNSRHPMDKESRTSSNSFYSEESEIEDPEQEENEVDSGLREVADNETASEVMSWTSEEQTRLDLNIKQELDQETDSEVMEQMIEELHKLREENKSLNSQLLEKDEEKREVIRQLSLSVNILKEENAEIRKGVKEPKKWGLFEFKMLGKGFFSGLSKCQPALIAL
ncbi:hypothetical protein Taro_044725 [Colocasia esculenta]|uniref:NAB domain-containing protein n=1 Tax=Colocasia esculenta TaxID=4460 RepID=A0A843X1E0_COLES|nr:hypothetical protein [Colocasia esculenta]